MANTTTSKTQVLVSRDYPAALPFLICLSSDKPSRKSILIETMEKGEEIIEGKVDWKGRHARKGVHGGRTPSWLILGLFAFDGLAIVAIIANLVTYFTEVMHLDIASASSSFTNLMGSSYLLAVVVGYLADVYIGRNRVILASASIYFLGLLLLTVQARFPSLKPPVCDRLERATSSCQKVKGGEAAMLFVALSLVALGMAGVKSCVPPHGADQFSEKDPKEAANMSSFFNWVLLSNCSGAAFSLTFVVWIQTDLGWAWGFAVSMVGFLIGVVIYVSGIPRYRFQAVQRSNPITEILQVFVAAIRNRKLEHPENPSELYEIEKDEEESAMREEFLPHRDMFRFLDKAAVRTASPNIGSNNEPQTPSAWKLCRVTQVENAKTILGILPIFASAIIMSTCLAQIQTFTVQQGLTMDTHFIGSLKIPPATMAIIPIGFLVIMVPIYDRLLVPYVRKFTGLPRGITHLQRVGVGLVLGCISMSVAAVIEVKRKNVARSNAMLDAVPVLQPLPISIFWLSFQYFIFGAADLFTYVGLLEFFYSEAPKKLKATATSFKWCAMSMGYFFSTVLVESVNSATRRVTKSGGWLAGDNLNRNHLNLFYWMLAVLSFANFLNYLFWASKYEYKYQTQTQLDTDVNPIP